MKMLINNCFGRYKISDNANIDLFMMGVFNLQPYYCEELSIFNGEVVIQCTNTNYIVHHDLEHIRDGFYKERYNSSSLYYNKDGKVCLPLDFNSRTDSRLIQIFEEKGSYYVSGNNSCLKLIEIPDGIEYVIIDDDGKEVVAENNKI